MHERENALKEWLAQTIQQKDFVLVPLAGDASFRRYFRIQYNGLTQVVMDAPPEKENIDPFLHIANVLDKATIPIPDILAINKREGFLLLSDLGDQLLLNKLNHETVDNYYNQAINLLLQIQKCSTDDSKLPLFDKSFMLKEMNLCLEWFLKAYLSLDLKQDELQLFQHTIEWIASEVDTQPRVFIHRDYHSRNLMLVKNMNNCLATIDFQDAMQGPVSYDLVSLLKDCYISWPREKVLEWVTYFHEKCPLANIYSLTDFIRAFDLCGLQRHLKVLGVFCRLYLRDNKAGYLGDLPLTLKYALECAEIYEELHPFYNFLQKRVYLP
ncbi:aminoglycoside phosphotransferase family protein [Legionella pneumophila]|uniref:Phosphotransferase n=1 Tax=Legionella pneumophila subsp. pascullei TaxID=91890 RepID=A0AAX2ITE1_LEGPN|nr:phosphotransferase [Legionella pneumophila]AMP91376.1 phosphotransferase [Legionella pneumophila subsp. pascullei]AMP94365.1 phosphotransferase [Legionella pneumophila subsp. pascullei]SQG89158.1 putative phosphotransferase [Legionella pneumophila subsp. pascullei]VEH04208.1 putative phosphotransferase [Legionella pneumophila subsp. pascullei]HDU8260797.1 phosphotransferase [Legionella pneumophila]